MPPMLILGSLLAIALMALLAWRLFPPREGLNADRIERNFRRGYPDETITNVILAHEGQTALLQLARPDTLGLVCLLGDRIVCRLVEAKDETYAVTAEGHVILHFDDFTLPRLSLALSEQDKALALAWLKPWCRPRLELETQTNAL